MSSEESALEKNNKLYLLQNFDSYKLVENSSVTGDEWTAQGDTIQGGDTRMKWNLFAAEFTSTKNTKHTTLDGGEGGSGVETTRW